MPKILFTLLTNLRNVGSNGLPQSFLQGEIPFDNSLVLLESKPKPQLHPSKVKSAIPVPVTLSEGIELTYTTQDWTGSEREISDGLYETYEPQSVLITEASDHPSPLVQSAAMASVAPPKPTYRPQLPQRLIRENILSTAQLESVIYAGESHRQFLKGNYQVDDNTLDRVSVASEDDPKPVQFRRGYFIGDSTGVGKGRQVSAVLLDNYLRGRKKALWISKSETLLEDARRDWKALGGNPEQIIPLSRFRQGESIGLTEGILFVTYATLRTEARQGKKSRVEQLINWCGQDFEGVIVFDEAHAMANASPNQGERGNQKASLQEASCINIICYNQGLTKIRFIETVT